MNRRQSKHNRKYFHSMKSAKKIFTLFFSRNSLLTCHNTFEIVREAVDTIRDSLLDKLSMLGSEVR